MQVKGTLTLTATNEAAAACKVQLAVRDPVGGINFQTHPKINKQLYDQNKVRTHRHQGCLRPGTVQGDKASLHNTDIRAASGRVERDKASLHNPWAAPCQLGFSPCLDFSTLTTTLPNPY